jgi:protein phosphatase
LLCTDGLTNFVDADVISNILSSPVNEDTANKLIDEANKNGGGDNITAVVIEL